MIYLVIWISAIVDVGVNQKQQYNAFSFEWMYLKSSPFLHSSAVRDETIFQNVLIFLFH